MSTEATSKPAGNSLAKAKADRLRFARRAGFQYGTKRNVYEVAGYVQQGGETFEHYRALYDRGDVAGRIVDMPAQTTWRNPPEIVEPGQEEGTDFTKGLESLVDRLSLWHMFERADRLAGIGRFGILLIGVKGDGDDGNLKNPMPQLMGPADVIYLSPFSEGDVTITQWERDPSDSRFGKPVLYEVDLSAGVEGFSVPRATVHHSRVIHIAEDLLEDEVFGRPRLKRVLNRLFDLEKITASTGEAYWQLAARILQAKIDPAAQMSDDEMDKMGEALEEMVHDLRRQFLGQGATLEWLGSVPPDPRGAANLCMMLIAAAAGIPMRILFGSETGERASTEDQKSWFGTIRERMERFAEPVILRAFIDRLVEHGGLDKPGADGYEVVWPSLFQESEKETAEANRTRAEAAKALTPIGGDPLDLVEIDADRNVWLRPTGERGEVDPESLDPEEPEPLSFPAPSEAAA